MFHMKNDKIIVNLSILKEINFLVIEIIEKLTNLIEPS